ncbi:MAG: TauD/TfdA family dioxygenase [Gammaproteobacteria bacterium]|nr:TauD/TfdA family dioxygenase [Gammaproteobacteria bacterium]
MAEPAVVNDYLKSENIDIRPLSGALGAEVRGVDIANLDNDGFAAIHSLLMEYSVLAIHDNPGLTDSQLRDWGLRWGSLDVHGYSPTVKGYDDVLNISSGPKRRASAEGWHSDVSWKEIPPKISMLHARKLPSVGGDTIYCSQYKAYEDLSENMKDFLEPLHAQHDGRNFDIDLIRKPVTHPIVITHPETGRKALYVNRGFTRRIPEFPPMESTAILNFLYDHCTRERYQARIRYESGTLSMWDNRCVQHCAVPDYGYEVRELHRVAVLCDERPSQ